VKEHNRKLLTYSIPDDFDPAVHVALGPWCFYKREHVYPNWAELPLCAPFADPQHRANRSNEAIQAANALLDELWPEMNARHGYSYSRQFWHIILMNWLIHLVMSTWRVWDTVSSFIEDNRDEKFTVCITKQDFEFKFENTLDFMLSLFGDSLFRSWLITEVTLRLIPNDWPIEYVERNLTAPSHNSLPPMELDQSWSPLGRDTGIPSRLRILLELYIRMLPRRRKQPDRHPSGMGFPQAMPLELVRLLEELRQRTMPRTLAHDIPKMREAFKSLPFKSGRLRLTAPTYHIDHNNFKNALASEAGERIVMLQHGGTYGWARTISMTGELEFWHDTFASWGFKTYDNYKARFRPLPPPFIGRMCGRYAPQDDRMILVGASMYGLNARIDNYPDLSPYRKRKRIFIDALSPELRSHLAYRGYEHHDTFDDGKYLRHFYPDLELVQGELRPQLLEAKLIVQDHHSTTLSMTLGANIPTIGIWDETAWPLGKDAKPFFDRLKAAKITFDDPTEAARHIESIWPDVQGWWNSPEVQDARKAWARQYGWGTKWWPIHWLLRLPLL